MPARRRMKLEMEDEEMLREIEVDCPLTGSSHAGIGGIDGRPILCPHPDPLVILPAMPELDQGRCRCRHSSRYQYRVWSLVVVAQSGMMYVARLSGRILAARTVSHALSDRLVFR